MMLLLIEKSKCWKCWWLKGQNAEDVVANRTVKVLKMLLIKRVQVLNMSLLIERSKCWICCCWSNQSKSWRCCWSKGPSAEDVAANWKIKMLKMLLIKDWRCCWWWRLKIEDEDYMMLKRFQWFIDVLPWWCRWCPLSLSYYNCCWCCCRIPFSLRGSVEIL